MSFAGVFEGRLDEKSRVSIPAPFRKLLAEGEQLRLYCRFNSKLNCLSLFPESTWKEMSAETEKKSKIDAVSLQKYYASFVMVEIDSVGRILLTKLKDVIKITNNEIPLIFAGHGKFINLYNKDTYEQMFNNKNVQIEVKK